MYTLLNGVQVTYFMAMKPQILLISNDIQIEATFHQKYLFC